jgi:hypothetical protein
MKEKINIRFELDVVYFLFILMLFGGVIIGLLYFDSIKKINRLESQISNFIVQYEDFILPEPEETNQ